MTLDQSRSAFEKVLLLLFTGIALERKPSQLADGQKRHAVLNINFLYGVIGQNALLESQSAVVHRTKSSFSIKPNSRRYSIIYESSSSCLTGLARGVMTAPPFLTPSLKRLYKLRKTLQLTLYRLLPSMSRRRSRAGGRRARKGAPRVVLSPFTLLSAAILLAYLVSTRSFSDLPKAYKNAINRVEGPENASLGDLGNVTSMEGIETDDEEMKNISERVQSRHERSEKRRHERIANIHHRIAHKHDARQAERQPSGQSTQVAPSTTSNADSDANRAVAAVPPTTPATSSSSNKAPAESKPNEHAPKGARTSGKLPEFRGSLGGTKDGMLRGQNITRVSYTIYKIMKLFGFSSMTDSPAGAHAEWMPEVVRRMTYDVPFFQYVGVDADGEKLALAKKAIGETVDGEFYEVDAEKGVPNGTEVLFHWTELDGSERDARSRQYVRHVARVMRRAKEKECGYIVLGQFPRLNGPSPAFRNGRWTFVGTDEEEPFLFNEHVRGVVPTANGVKAYMLYLTFYSLKSIPAAALEAVL